jgi:hypothetical protein
MLASWAGPSRAAAPVVEVQNVRVGFGARNLYKVGAWTPVWVQLKAGTQGFKGHMDLLVPDDDGIPVASRQPIDIGPNESPRLIAYGRPGGQDTEFNIRLLDVGGRVVVNAPQVMTMPAPPLPILPEERLILTMGQPMGVDQVANLPGAIATRRWNGTAGAEFTVERIDAMAGQLPGRWYGFDAAEAVVIDTNDRNALQSLEGLRGQALVEWVRRGGHLVVAVGENWQAVRDSVIGPILPARPNGQERVTSLDAIDTFADSNKPLTPPGTPPVLVTRLEGSEERGWKPLSQVGNLPLVIRGAEGFGRVTLIGLGVDQKLFADWPDRGLFWARAIDLKVDRPEQKSGAQIGGGGTRFIQSGVSDLSSRLRIGLEQFPGVKLIPFGWVAFFIFLYILMIGPGDYFLLRKVFKRMELTWVTFPTTVVAVSLLAYFAAYRLKGNDLLVNKVDVVDVDQPSGLVRGRTLVSLFSPQNHDYGIGFVPVPPNLDHAEPPLGKPTESGEPPRPPAGTEVVTSWFSVPEPQFGGMGGSSRRFSFAGGGYSYQPVNGAERLEGVRVPIWSTKTITARWFGPGSPMVDAELRSVSSDRLAGIVVNRQNFPLKDALLAFGKQVYTLGDLAPGQTVRVELSNDRNLSGLLKDRSKTYLSDEPWDRNVKIDRANLLLALMFHESESTRGVDEPLSNSALDDLDLTGQLAIERPMLVARIDRPGSQLVLRNPPAPPKIDQTTVLRIILPLQHAPAGGDGRTSLPGEGRAPSSRLAAAD